MNLKFSGRGIAFLAHYKSNLDIRHSLLGVHLRPAPALVGGVVGLASNGHVLGIWHDPDGIVERPVTLRVTPELVRACGRRKPRGWPSSPDLVLRDGRLACVVGAAEIYVQPRDPDYAGEERLRDGNPWEIDAKYPDVSRVLMEPDKLAAGPVDPIAGEYLALIHKSFRAVMPGRVFFGVVLRQADPGGVVLASTPVCANGAAVVMPQRWGGRRDQHDRDLGWLGFVARAARVAGAAAGAPLPVHEPSDAGPA